MLSGPMALLGRCRLMQPLGILDAQLREAGQRRPPQIVQRSAGHAGLLRPSTGGCLLPGTPAARIRRGPHHCCSVLVDVRNGLPRSFFLLFPGLGSLRIVSIDVQDWILEFAQMSEESGAIADAIRVQQSRLCLLCRKLVVRCC